jgi:hypothetical protein
MTIVVSGCSYTSGEESTVAWPAVIEGTVNLAKPGASNDYIVRSIVNYVAANPVDQAIVAWTTPNRIELGDQHLTPTSQRRYGAVVDAVFAEWDTEWASNKFYTQQLLLHSYLQQQGIPHLFVAAFDVPPVTADYWLPGAMTEWQGGCPKGPGGHPLELGHTRIAEHIYEHIRHLGWVSRCSPYGH